MPQRRLTQRCTGRRPRRESRSFATLSRAVGAGERQAVRRAERGDIITNMPVTRNFGFLPLPIAFKNSLVEISPLETLTASVESVNKSTRVKDGWFYPQIDGPRGLSPKPVFVLPMTHELTLPSMSPAHTDADQLSEYLIATVGFMHGILLIPDGWVHLSRVKVDATRTYDYWLRDSARQRVFCAAIDFWQRYPSQRHRMFGVMHWHCMSLSYIHDYEIFAWQYTVFDACWHLHNSITSTGARVRHEQRVGELAKAYQLKIPTAWNEGKELVRVRNELFHEARWGDQSIGFAAKPSSDEYLISSLIAFNTRVILAILGESGPYVRSEPGSTYYLLD